MMINRRLIRMIGKSKRYIAANVAYQWCSLIANIAMMMAITSFLSDLMTNASSNVLPTLGIACIAVAVRFLCAIGSARMSHLSSQAVKRTLRERVYKKLLRLGNSYHDHVTSSEVVQIAVEGVDQLETYFGAYLPQFFYAMLAPLTLFACLCFVNVACAIALPFCVPLIPVAIAAVQTWAQKLLSRYWGQYAELGNIFLENLQGLTTLKIYQANDFKQAEMNVLAEKFRKITMKVLIMQLNSISIMDFIAYGGAALGMILAATQFQAGNVSLRGALLILLLSAEFFIPMRQLGSFFHVAMNGIAASDKIFRLLDLPEPAVRDMPCPANGDIRCKELCFSYGGDRTVLDHVDLSIPCHGLTAIVGESGSGKSTIASVLMGRCRNYQGSVTIGDTELCNLSEDSLMRHITYIGHQSYLFKGTVRENLHMGDPSATDRKLWNALNRVKLARFLQCEQGLDTQIAEKGNNLSGGQRQRLALARALLHDSPVYVFDEATSNIDVESEDDIMREVHKLAKNKAVILITHRLANVVDADQIYAMEGGKIHEHGDHNVLLAQGGIYAKLWNTQQNLESYRRDGDA